MPRPRRRVIPGVPYHIVQRASHKEFILNDEVDRAVFMKILLEWREQTGILIAAYVLMGNHFHLAGVSPTPNALARFMGNACSEFSRYLNAKSGRRGPNWQGRFYAAPMDPAHAVAAVRYIERNPVVAGLVCNAWDWSWSSAAFHCGVGPRPRLLTLDLRPPGTNEARWREMLGEDMNPALVARLREATTAGRALGAKDWVAGINEALGQDAPRARGRPPTKFF